MTTPEIQGSVASYDVSLLMAQTRELAADYRQQTGQALPVTEELARFDAVTILGLDKVEGLEGVDAVDKADLKVTNPDVSKLSSTKSDAAITDQVEHVEQVIKHYLIKGRVIFKGGKARQKLGKLTLQGSWSNLLMVIYNADYLPTQIYSVKRIIIDKEMECISPDKRGSMTVAKYKAIGKLVWSEPPETDIDLMTEQSSKSFPETALKNLPEKP